MYNIFFSKNCVISAFALKKASFINNILFYRSLKVEIIFIMEKKSTVIDNFTLAATK